MSSPCPTAVVAPPGRRGGATARHLSRLFALTLIAFLAASPTALAHQGDPNYRSVIDRIEPAQPDLELEVIDYDADLRLTAPAATRIEIPGYEGEPYARIIADGTVQVNVRSPSAYLNADRYGDTPIPDEADPEAEPTWETIRSDGTFQWHDHRSHWMSPEPPEHVQGVTERTEIFDYEIPILVDGEPTTIHGTLYWVGPEQGGALPFLLAGAAILLAAGVLTAIVRRRRQADGRPGPESEPW